MSSRIKMIIEALLFSTERPLNAKDIHFWLPDEKMPEIKQALVDLKSEYENLERSFTLKEVAKGYQFRTKQEYSPFILKMFKTTPSRLSRAALESLAIIAYKQPILRHEIERLRGVDVGGILRTLLEKGLIRIVGRKNLPGRPLIYGTTKRFLEVFDLKDLDSLPKLKEIEDLGADENPIEPTSESESGENPPQKIDDQQDTTEESTP